MRCINRLNPPCKTVGRFDLLVQAGIGRLFKTSERRYANEELFLGSL